MANAFSKDHSRTAFVFGLGRKGAIVAPRTQKLSAVALELPYWCKGNVGINGIEVHCAFDRDFVHAINR